MRFAIKSLFDCAVKKCHNIVEKLQMSYIILVILFSS